MGKQRLSEKFLKALSIFGSLEALKMICSIVRTKLVALWIGTAGVGVISLYNSTLDTLKSVCFLNMRSSCIPAIASESDEDRRNEISRYVDSFGMIVGTASTILVILLSPLLSLLSFGSLDYTWGFALLAPTMLASAVIDAKQSILQGLGKLRVLAVTSLYAVIASTVVAIPLFYFFRMAAIVPVLIVFPVFGVLFIVMHPQAKLQSAPHNREMFRAVVRTLVQLGSFLTIGVAIGFAADYALRIYLERVGDIETVGLFQAGYTIVKSYVGLFFTAVAIEFFPRLSTTISRRSYTSVIVSHEIFISLLILTPVMVMFIGLNDILVEMLYSSSFLSVVPYITVAIIASPLRAFSWCCSYVILAKGDGKVYIITESVSAVSLLVFSFIGWHLGGFAGLGWAFVGQFLMFTVATWAVCHVKYKLRISGGVVGLSALSMIMGLTALGLRLYIGWWASLIVLIPAALIILYAARKKKRPALSGR